MKAIVFGGAGIVGSFAVKFLSTMDTFSKVIIADINESTAKQIKKTSDKIDYTKIDVTDDKNLSTALNDADIAINCVGPFYKFASRIINATISKGINYVDVCDDYDTTEKLLDNYNKKAKDVGVTCIIGLGASPGLTNIIAAFASNQLTTVESIKVYVTRSIEEEAGGAIPYHMIHCWLGEIPIFNNGRFQKARGLIDGEEYTKFPEPFGQSAVYYFGHPETVTLPRYINGVKNVCCKGSFFPFEFRDALLQLQSLGLLSEETINVMGQQIKPLDFTAKYIESLRKRVILKSKNIPSGGSVMVEVSGEKDSEPKTIKYAGTSHMREGTATPAVIGAKMIAEGEIKKHGVYAPEGCVSPEKFIINFLGDKGLGEVWVTVTQKMDTLF